MHLEHAECSLPPFLPYALLLFSLLSLCMYVKVSYLSSAPHLSDNSRFPYHVRVEPAESIIHKSQGIIAAQFGWEEVTWIVQNEEVFVSVSQTMISFHKFTIIVLLY